MPDEDLKLGDKIFRESSSTLMKITGTIISFLFVGYSINLNVVYLNMIARAYLLYDIKGITNFLHLLGLGFYTIFVLYLIIGFFGIIDKPTVFMIAIVAIFVSISF